MQMHARQRSASWPVVLLVSGGLLEAAPLQRRQRVV